MFRGSNRRYDGSVDGCEVKQKMFVELPVVGKKRISWGS